MTKKINHNNYKQLNNKNMSENDFNSGALVMFMWILTIALSIGSGVLAWNWIAPNSFLGVIGFLILWGLLSKVVYFIFFGILYSIFDR